MVTDRQATRAWHDHLVEEVGVDEATILTDRLDGVVTRDILDDALRRQSREFDHSLSRQEARLERQSQQLEDRLERQSQQLEAQLDEKLARVQHQMASGWRKDLLLVSIGQFFALAAAVGALAALG